MSAPARDRATDGAREQKKPGGQHRLVWRLAVPNILANLTIPLLGAVDTAVVGRLGAAEIGAVAVGATVFSFLYWSFSFLRMGTAGIAAQAHGAGDTEALLATLLRAGTLAAGVGLAMIALQEPIILAALALIAPSDAVTPLAESYLAIRIWCAPAAICNMVLLGWLIGRQRMMIGLILQLVINGANMALDVVLAVWLDMGVAGVAAATVIAQYAGLAAGLRVVRSERLGLGRRAAWPWRSAWARDALAQMMRLNRDIFVRTLCVIVATSMLTALGARFGDLVLAANGILMLFQAFMSYGLDGFAHAAEALVGAAIGKRNRAELAAVVRVSTLWAGIVAIGYAIVFAIAGAAIVAAITTVPDVRAAVADYLPWAVASPLVSVWAFQLDGIFIGATRGRVMRNAMLVAFAGYLAALWLLVPMWANHGLWCAFLILMALRAVTLAAAYPALARSVPAADSG